MDRTASSILSGTGSRLVSVVRAVRHRPLVVATAAFAFGVVAGPWRWTTPTLLGAALGLVLAGVHLGSRAGVFVTSRAPARDGAGAIVAVLMGLAMATAFAACGAFRAHVQSVPGPYDISRWIGSGYVSVAARVASEPEVRFGARFVARPYAVRPPDGQIRSSAGFLRCSIPLRREDRIPRYGDAITISGTLESTADPRNSGPIGLMPRHGVFAAICARYPSQWRCVSGEQQHDLVRMALSWRNSMLHTFSSYLPMRDAALATGISLGGVQGMTESQADAFRRSGLVHIVAASGSNVAILCGPLYWLTRRLYLTRRQRAAVCCAATLLYAVAVGAQPAVTRAAIMATVYLSAPLFDRERDAPTALAAAALAALMWDPGTVSDTGFLLSFTIVAALLAFWPACERGIKAGLPPFARTSVPYRSRPASMPARLLRTCLRGVAATIGISSIAAMAAAPLTAQVFNTVPTLGIVANALAAPALVVLLPASLCAGLAAPISPDLSRLLSCVVIGPFTSYVGRVAETVAAWPGAVWYVRSPGWPMVFLCYTALAVGAVVISRDDQP